jgi:hypothetical protein
LLGVNGLSDSIAWPSRDPQWVSKVLLNGLIMLIPIVGTMVVLGWMLAALDNLRAGRPELPPAGFSHLGRGVNLFVVLLVYTLGLVVLFTAVLAVALVVLAVAPRDAGALSAAGLLFLDLGLVTLVALAIYLLTPPIVVATERGGIGGGLNVAAVVRLVRADPENALHAGLFALVAYLIGSVGAIACGVGQIFTGPYGYAILAGVVRHYERVLGERATPVG